MFTAQRTSLTIQKTSSGSMPRFVLVVDSDPRTMDVVSGVVRGLGGYTRMAQTPETALELARTHAPAAVIAAVELGGRPHGVTLGRTIRQRCGSAIVLIDQRLPQQHVTAIASLRPEAFLCKPLHPDQIDATLRLAFRRRVDQSAGIDVPRDADLARTLRQIAALVNQAGVASLGPETRPSADRLLATLRPREQEVVRLLFEHHRVPTIAARLDISQQTVRNHLKRVFMSLGVHSQEELIARLRTPGESSSPAA